MISSKHQERERRNENENDNDDSEQLENVYDVWIANRSKLRGYSTVCFDRLQRTVEKREQIKRTANSSPVSASASTSGKEGRLEQEEQRSWADDDGERLITRSCVFVRGSGLCVLKAVQVAEYVRSRFKGGFVYQHVSIGTVPAGKKQTSPQEDGVEREDREFSKERPMISIGLSLSKTRLKQVVDRLERIESFYVVDELRPFWEEKDIKEKSSYDDLEEFPALTLEVKKVQKQEKKEEKKEVEDHTDRNNNNDVEENDDDDDDDDGEDSSCGDSVSNKRSRVKKLTHGTQTTRVSSVSPDELVL